MVYESDFYTNRRPYRPSSYSTTTPRHYVVVDSADRPRRATEQYSYSYTNSSESSTAGSGSGSGSGSGRPRSTSSTYSSTTERRSGTGPGTNYDYTTERSSSHGDGPGSYRASYSSTTSGRLPYGTTYRHYSYRVVVCSGGGGGDQETFIPLRYVPILSLGKVHAVSSFHPSYGGSRRLVQSRVAPHRIVAVRVRPSVVIRELDRIENKIRPSVGYSASEDYLCSASSKNWEDESRKIRAQTASLLQQVHHTVPRAMSVAPYTTVARYNEKQLPFRLQSYEHYINNLVAPVRKVAKDILNMSWYAEPVKRFTGRGNLACVRYSGAKAFPNRRTFYQDFSVKDDVTLLSFYVKNRLAAVGLALENATAAPDVKKQPASVECS